MASSRKTSPWNDDYNDFGVKPGRLYKKITLNVDNLLTEVVSSKPIEVGGYKWKIFGYPRGYDVRGYLSLFLSVANHEKLYTGWSYLAMFTNNDPKKSKHSDALHCFRDKEYEWGWKQFIERPKLLDGFICNKAITVELHIQVIRERTNRLFRCLSRQYREKLVPVYLTDVEQVFRSFVDEKTNKLTKVLEDECRWSRLSVYWQEANDNDKKSMSREKSDLIMKAIVKQFFKEDEVTSTLVMDSLYCGLKSLEDKTVEEILAPIVKMENDTFILVDDVLQLLKNVVQNLTEDGGAEEEVNEYPIELVEWHLTILGRRIIEIFVLEYIFRTKIEDAYRKADKKKKKETNNNGLLMRMAMITMTYFMIYLT